MKKNIVTLLVVTALTIFGISSFATVLTFWNAPFNTGEVTQQYVNWWKANVTSALPEGYTVSDYFGPGSYTPMLNNFILQAKTGKPDVIEGLIENLTVYTRMDLLSSLNNWFDNWSQKNEFVKSTIDAVTINGKMYAIPYNTNVRVLLYRKDIFKKYGLSVPKTWSELVTTAASITKLTDGKVYGFNFSSAVNDPRAFQEFMSWYFQVSNKDPMFKNENGTWVVTATKSNLEKVLKLYRDLIYANKNYPAVNPQDRGDNYTQEDLGYVSGQYAMVANGPWLWGRLNDNELSHTILASDTGIAALPIPAGGVHASYLEVKPIMISRFSKHQTAAWDLLKFIVSKDAMARWAEQSGFLPARKDSFEIYKEYADQHGFGWWVEGFEKQMPYGVGLAPINWAPVQKDITTAMNMAIYDISTPNEAADWLYSKLNELSKQGVL